MKDNHNKSHNHTHTQKEKSLWSFWFKVLWPTYLCEVEYPELCCGFGWDVDIIKDGPPLKQISVFPHELEGGSSDVTSSFCLYAGDQFWSCAFTFCTQHSVSTKVHALFIHMMYGSQIAFLPTFWWKNDLEPKEIFTHVNHAWTIPLTVSPLNKWRHWFVCAWAGEIEGKVNGLTSTCRRTKKDQWWNSWLFLNLSRFFLTFSSPYTTILLASSHPRTTNFPHCKNSCK